MNTILIIAFILATKAGFLLWAYKTGREYYTDWRSSGSLFPHPWMKPVDMAIDVCIMVAGVAWLFGSGIA